MTDPHVHSPGATLVPGLEVPTELLIGGQWRPAIDRGTFEIVDPADGIPIARVANGTVEDALACVDAAEAAAPGWAATSPRDRAEILRGAFDMLSGHEEPLAELIVRENGKAWPDAISEVRYATEFFRWFSEEAVRLTGCLMTAPSGANRIVVLRQPIGISLLVTPWNFPAAMATRKLAPALAAGCTTILKPASDTPLTALAIGHLLQQAGVPAGVVNVLPSRRSAAIADAVLHDPRVRKLSFTGSTEVGRALLRVAADNVISCSMELGGNAPVIVCADADLDVAVAGTMVAKMRNGGEACTAANRIYVHHSITQEFSRRLAVAMDRISVGSGLNRSVELGPLINQAALEKVDSLVGDAITHGAHVVTGGRRLGRDGFFYPPTVLTDVPADARLLQEEIFGPVAPVIAFEHVEDVIAAANETPYGLVAYVFTQDLAQGLRISERLDTGMVGLNRGVVSDPAAPFGGVKQSGLGREGAHEGILEFTEAKYIATLW